MKTLCCDYEFKPDDHPVKWNPVMSVIQCHNCGAIWAPLITGESCHKDLPAVPVDQELSPKVALLAALEAMSGGADGTVRARFAECLLARLVIPKAPEFGFNH